MLITAVDPTNPRIAHLLRRGIPLVFVDRLMRGGPPEWCAVGVDDVEGGDLAVEHLVERGHRRIAFIGGPITIPQVADRQSGAQRAIARAGLGGDALTVIPTVGLTFADGRQAGEKLMGIPSRRRPTAAFCANDLVAVGLLQHLTQHGVAVPDDMAIVGYDDIEYAAAAAVPLSSVASHATNSGVPPHGCCSTRPSAAASTCTNRWCSHPSWSPGPRPPPSPEAAGPTFRPLAGQRLPLP